MYAKNLQKKRGGNVGHGSMYLSPRFLCRPTTLYIIARAVAMSSDDRGISDYMYLCFYDHNFPYVVRHFNFKNSFGFAHTPFMFNAAVVWGGQVVETKIYFRFRHSTRPPSCRGKIRAAHFPANV